MTPFRLWWEWNRYAADMRHLIFFGNRMTWWTDSVYGPRPYRRRKW